MINEMLAFNKVDPLQYSPNGFSQIIRLDIEKKDTLLVMIDSIASYQLPMSVGFFVGLFKFKLGQQWI